MSIPPLLAKQTYIMVKSGSLQKRINEINENIKQTGFVAIKNKSNRDIVYFENPETKQTYIAHRGTDTSGKKTKVDLTGDLAYMFGLEKHSKEFKKRATRTSKLIKTVPDDHKVDLVSHSYGGATANYTLLNKKNVRDRIENHHTFNPLSSPFNHKSSKKKDKEMDKIVITNRTENDIVSKAGQQHGITNTFKQTEHVKVPIEVGKHLQNTFDKVEQLSAHSLDNFIKD
jgi:hypothetical protein